MLEGVKEAHRIVSPYKLASRELPAGRQRSVRIGDVEIGGERVVAMAGPCSVENEDQIEAAAAVSWPRGRKGDPRRRVQAAQLSLQLSRASARPDCSSCATRPTATSCSSSAR